SLSFHFGGKPISMNNSNRQLKDYNIKSGSTIITTIRLHGGNYCVICFEAENLIKFKCNVNVCIYDLYIYINTKINESHYPFKCLCNKENCELDINVINYFPRNME